MLADAVDTFLREAARPTRDLALQRHRRGLERRLGHAFDVQAKAFLRRFAALKPKFPEMQEAIRNEDWEPLLDQAFRLTRGLFRKALDRAVQTAMRLGFAGAGVDVSFSLENPRAVAYLRDHGAELVAGIEQTTRDEIRTILTQAADEGWSHDKAARAIGQRFTEFRVGRPQEHVRSRAHLVAMTELGNAYEHGNLAAAEQAHADGIQMEKSWLTAHDDRVSDDCRANEEAGWIGIADAFPSGAQRPLQHPGCRCALLTRVKEEG